MLDGEATGHCICFKGFSYKCFPRCGIRLTRYLAVHYDTGLVKDLRTKHFVAAHKNNKTLKSIQQIKNAC